MKYIAPHPGSGRGPNDEYIDGNPAESIIGSIPPAAAIEHPMREIMHVIESEPSITPSEASLTQLLEAIQLKIAAVNSGGNPIPVASETQKGIAERSTNQEANAGTDTERFVTPAQLHSVVNANAANTVLTEIFEATNVTYSTGSGSVTLNHGLSGRPRIVKCWVRVKSTGDGLTAGDYHQVDGSGFQPVVTDTQIKIRIADGIGLMDDNGYSSPSIKNQSHELIIWAAR